MTTHEDVISFLNEFKMKMDIWDIVFLDTRPKNLQTLADLEITPFKRKTIIKELVVQDFSEGPIEEIVFMGASMWVFGKEIKNKEIYIKISMGLPSKQTLCISFHIAEFPMNYPFKTTKR